MICFNQNRGVDRFPQWGGRSGGALLVSVAWVVVTGERWAGGLLKAKPLRLSRCSLTIAPMNTSKTPSKLSRAQLSQALDSVPVSHLLGRGASKELTGKQKRFALEVAKGSSGAEAYRAAYNTRGKSLTQSNEASRLKARPDVAAEVEAYRVALETETYRTPAALRALVVQTLAAVLVDPDAKQAVKVQAAKAIGAMTEVSLFTHRTETRVVRSSEDARAELMAQIMALSNAEAEDVTPIDAGDSLMAELSGQGDTHRPPAPLAGSEESPAYIHTIPLEQTPLGSIPDEQSLSPSIPLERSVPDAHAENLPSETPPPSLQDDPPSLFKK